MKKFKIFVKPVLKQQQWSAVCGLHSAAKEIEKNVLAVSAITYHLPSFDSIHMSSMAALSGGMTSFMLASTLL